MKLSSQDGAAFFWDSVVVVCYHNNANWMFRWLNSSLTRHFAYRSFRWLDDALRTRQIKYALTDRVEISSSCQRIVLSANWFVSDTQMKPNCLGYYYIIALLHCYYTICSRASDSHATLNLFRLQGRIFRRPNRRAPLNLANIICYGYTHGLWLKRLNERHSVTHRKHWNPVSADALSRTPLGEVRTLHNSPSRLGEETPASFQGIASLFPDICMPSWPKSIHPPPYVETP